MSTVETTESVPKFAGLNNLASSSAGGQILFATDDFFATAECLLKDSEPVFDPLAFTEFGKEMDGWETRRKRIAGHDWCIIKLGAACKIEGVLADTANFTGNYAPRISVQGASLIDESLIPKRKAVMGSACSAEDLKQVEKLHSDKWMEIIKMTHLQPGYPETRLTYIPVDSTKTFTQ